MFKLTHLAAIHVGKHIKLSDLSGKIPLELLQMVAGFRIFEHRRRSRGIISPRSRAIRCWFGDADEWSCFSNTY